MKLVHFLHWNGNFFSPHFIWTHNLIKESSLLFLHVPCVCDLVLLISHHFPEWTLTRSCQVPVSFSAPFRCVQRFRWVLVWRQNLTWIMKICSHPTREGENQPVVISDFWFLRTNPSSECGCIIVCDGCSEIDPGWASLLISPSFIHEQQQLIGWPELFCWYRWFPRSPFYSVASKLLSFLAFGSSLAFRPRLVFTEQLPAPQSGLFYQNSGLESGNWSSLCRVATWF